MKEEEEKRIALGQEANKEWEETNQEFEYFDRKLKIIEDIVEYFKSELEEAGDTIDDEERKFMENSMEGMVKSYQQMQAQHSEIDAKMTDLNFEKFRREQK